jgi:hypothetical protein
MAEKSKFQLPRFINRSAQKYIEPKINVNGLDLLMQQ